MMVRAGGRRRRRSVFGLIGSNQHSIRTAGGESRSLRKITWKEGFGGCAAPTYHHFRHGHGLMDIMLAVEDQSQADQPNSLAEGPPV
eukprot:1153575-Pelagomonas_calceolata.AAC.1